MLGSACMSRTGHDTTYGVLLWVLGMIDRFG